MARYGDLGTQYFDDAGDPLVSGRIYFYETGTTTPKTTYADVDFTIPNTNPVILTAAGRQPNIFFDGVAKAILTTSTGTQILVRDPVGDTANSFGNPWIASKRYTSNDVVQGSDGQYYVSLINGNVNNNPVTTTGSWTFLYSVEWSAGTTYKLGSVVTYETIVYQSLQNTNLNKNPLSETSYWVPIQLVWNSTATYAINANVVGTDGVLYTSLQNANTGNTPASSPSWWVGSSAAAAASASAALASETAAAASAATATTQAGLASSSASSASSSASSASSSASSASTSASNASTSETNAAASAASAAASQSASAASASSASGSATNALNSANASAASAASAAAIANLSSVQVFTDPLAKAIRVALLASASVRAPQVLDNLNLDMGTNNFSVVVQKRITTTRPAANEILYHKHNGTEGVIVTLLTTGIVRLTLNATTFDSTTALTSASNVEPVIIIPVTRETTTAAGSVTFVVDGVQLGSALVISARVEEIVNGTFATDIASWTLATGSGGSIAWSAGSLRVTRSGDTAAYQAVALAAGETLFVSCVATYVSGASSTASLVIRSGPEVNSTALATATTAASSSGTLRVSYYSAAAATVYVHLRANVASAVYDFDTVTSLDTYSVDNSSNLYLLGTSTTTTEGSYYDGAIYNRALSVTECLAYCLRGPDIADVQATGFVPSQTPFYTADFSAGTDSFSATSATATGNVDGIGGKDNTYRFVSNGSASGRTSRILTLISARKKSKLVFEAYRPSANVTCTQIQVRLTVGTSSSGTTVVQAFPLAADTWTTCSVEIPVVDTVTAISFYFNDAGGLSSNNTSGDTLYLASGLTVTQIGVTGHWPAFNAQTNTGQIFDQSGNKNHMLLPASGATILGTPQSMRRQVRWTNTWAATQELQYIGGVNQAILPANAYIESIVGTVSGATPHDIIIGDGSDTDRYVTITTGLATGTTTFTLASRVTDGTNLKLTVDPDTDATMSIAWVITYTILET